MAIADRDIVAAGPRTRVRAFTRADVDAWQAWPDYAEQLLVGTSPRRMAPDQRSRWFDDITQRQRQIPFAVDDDTGVMIGRFFLRPVIRCRSLLPCRGHPRREFASGAGRCGRSL